MSGRPRKSQVRQNHWRKYEIVPILEIHTNTQRAYRRFDCVKLYLSPPFQGLAKTRAPLSDPALYKDAFQFYRQSHPSLARADQLNVWHIICAACRLDGKLILRLNAEKFHMRPAPPRFYCKAQSCGLHGSAGTRRKVVGGRFNNFDAGRSENIISMIWRKMHTPKRCMQCSLQHVFC